MAQLTVPRVLGGTLILTAGPVQAALPTTYVAAIFRDGRQQALHRDGETAVLAPGSPNQGNNVPVEGR